MTCPKCDSPLEILGYIINPKDWTSTKHWKCKCPNCQYENTCQIICWWDEKEWDEEQTAVYSGRPDFVKKLFFKTY